MRIDIGWLLFIVILATGAWASMLTKNSNNFYDKRNWACAEYGVDMERNEKICVSLERTVNK